MGKVVLLLILLFQNYLFIFYRIMFLSITIFLYFPFVFFFIFKSLNKIQTNYIRAFELLKKGVSLRIARSRHFYAYCELVILRFIKCTHSLGSF